MRRYIRRYHRDTIRKIISSWAPSSENATENYIDFVAKKTGLDQDEVLHFGDRKVMVSLVRAMAQYECGIILDEDEVITSYEMA